jgi:hypothetical protein
MGLRAGLGTEAGGKFFASAEDRTPILTELPRILDSNFFIVFQLIYKQDV